MTNEANKNFGDVQYHTVPQEFQAFDSNENLNDFETKIDQGYGLSLLHLSLLNLWMLSTAAPDQMWQ